MDKNKFYKFQDDVIIDLDSIESFGRDTFNTIEIKIR